MIGNRILHYDIIEKLGEGGMGEVYLAEDTKLHRRVALKFLHRTFREDKEAHERLFREARAASRLSHANIVAIHAIEETDEHIFIAMEYVQGESLRDIIKRGPLDVDRALDIATQILGALAGAHETSIVHRDIKSDNIVVTESGRVKVLDFGLAKARGAATITRAGSSAGTPAYMSPEQVQGAAVDHRSDLFSFGVVLYEMLTGRLPFKGEHESAVTYSIVNEDPDPLSTYRDDLPPSLQPIVDRALDKNPETRYQSAAEIEADVARARTGAAPADTGAGPNRRGGSSKPFAIGALIAVALIAGYVALRGGGDGEPASVESVATATDERKMLAVLPFQNLGPTDHEYFADGVTEEITTRLAKVSGLGVISRTSAVAYKGTTKSLREIGDELDIDFALEGTIRWDKSGATDRVRISAQLIRVTDDTHLWAETYDRVYAQIFDLQSEIAEEVAEALNVTLLAPEVAALKERPTENLDAYDLYLKGREYWDSFTGIDGGVEQRRLAAETLERAVALDSSFAKANALLARIYANDHFNNLFTDEPRIEQALDRARAALEAAPDQPAGHIAMGYYHYYGSRDYEKALEEFAEAAKFEPNDADLLEAMGYVLRRQGRWEEAVEKLERSVELDPQSRDKLSAVIDALVAMRRYDEARTYIDRGIDQAPESPHFPLYKALVLTLESGDTDGALAVINEAQRRYNLALQAFEGPVLVMARRYDDALDLYSGLDAWSPMDTTSYYNMLAQIYHFKDMEERSASYYDSLRAHTRSRIDAGSENWLHYTSLAEAEAALGNRDAARKAMRRAEEIMPMSRDAVTGPNVIVNRAVVRMILGEEDAAIDDLEFLLSVPAQMSRAVLRIHPGFDPLRDNPRFQKLIATKTNS